MGRLAYDDANVQMPCSFHAKQSLPYSSMHSSPLLPWGAGVTATALVLLPLATEYLTS